MVELDLRVAAKVKGRKHVVKNPRHFHDPRTP
jgi:hypothetical protein